ncbi:MAG: GDSL-type esterase/lipase family protein [Eubacteriales bacterium]
MKTILCYGDSNTWGACPYTGNRYGLHIRWTGLLQSALGTDFRIIEAGLNGRTTIYSEPDDPYLNGRDMLIPTLRQAEPVDLLILMLGTNDLKRHSAFDATSGITQLVKMAKEQTNLFTKGKPQILVISPVTVEEPYFPLMADPRGHCNHQESLKFAGLMQYAARAQRVHFLDAATVAAPKAQPDGDGIHLDKEGHADLAKAILAEVQRILG